MTRVYKGCRPDPGNIIREMLYEYEGDLDGASPKTFQTRHWFAKSHAYDVGTNVRMKKQTTRVTDVVPGVGGPPEATVEYSDWDGRGHYRSTIERNQLGEVYRTRKRDYQPVDSPWFGGKFNSDILLSASGQPIERTDYCWGTDPANQTKPTVVRRRRDAVPSNVCTTVTTGDVVEQLDYETTGASDLPLGVLKQRTLSGGDLDGTASFATKFLYAPGGYLKKQQRVFTPPQNWFDVDRDWDSTRGVVIASRDSAGVLQTNYSYDGLGRLTLIDVPSPEADTTITYGEDGRSVEVAQANSTLGQIWSKYLYDSLYRLTKEQRLMLDGSLSERLTQYDAAGRVTGRTEWAAVGSQNYTSGYGYDFYTGPKCQDKDEDGTTDEDYNGFLRTYTDPLGRITAEAHFGANSSTRYEGLKTTVSGASIMGLGDVAITPVTRYTNDVFGRLVSVDNDADGTNNASYTYDERDNLTGVSLVESADDDHDGTVVTQPRSFGYDSLDRLRWAINPENGTQQYTQYDALGNLRGKIDPLNRTLAYGYDEAGRLTSVQLAPSSVFLELDAYSTTDGRLVSTESYDDTGAMVSIRTRVYSGLNKRLGELQVKLGGSSSTPPVLKTLYSYNNFGMVSEIDYPLADTETRTRSKPTYATVNGYVVNLFDLTRVGSSAPIWWNTSYTAAGNPGRINAPNGVKFDMTYDEWNRPLRYQLFQTRTGGACPARETQGSYCNPYSEFPCVPAVQQPGLGGCESGSDIWWDTQYYDYDPAGNIIQIGFNVNTYRYDSLGRILEGYVEKSQGLRTRQNWTYDSFGNMLTRTTTPDGGSSTTLTINASKTTNRITNTIDGLTGITYPYQYDQSGNLTRDDKYLYSWDNRGRMASVQSQGDETIGRYSYDSSGYRVRKIEDERETFYVRDEAGQVLSEFKCDGSSDGTASNDPVWDKDYVYALGKVAYLVKNKTPAAPRNLWVSNISNSAATYITLHWDPVNEPDIGSYQMQRCVDTDGTGSATPSCTTIPLPSTPSQFQDMIGPPAITSVQTVVRYRLKAKDTASNASAYSVQISVRPAPAATGPSKPSWATTNPVTVGDKKVKLRWNLDTAEDIAGYRVYRDSGQGYVLLNPATSTDPNLIRFECESGIVCYTDTGLTNNQTYYYKLKSEDNAILSGYLVVSRGLWKMKMAYPPGDLNQRARLQAGPGGIRREEAYHEAEPAA